MSSLPPPPGPPPLSPDGRWWWDGSAWRPVHPMPLAAGVPWPYGGYPCHGVPVPVRASGGARFVAYIVDSLLVLIAAAAVVLLGNAYQQVDLATTTVNGFYATGSQSTYVLTPAGYVFAGIVILTYFATQWATSAATLGQRMLHLRVLDLATGRRLDWGQSLVRAAWFGGSTVLGAVHPLLGMFAGLVALVGIAMGLGASGQGLHDRTARSIVIRG